MNKFDAAVGMDATTLDTGIAGLYADPQARAKIFKGTEDQDSAKVSWDIQAAPVVVLAPPSDADWQKSINDKGKNPTGSAPAGTFQLQFPKFHGSATLGGGTPVAGTAKVRVYAQASINGSTLTIKPLSIWIGSKPSGWGELVVKLIVIGVLKKMTTMLAGLHIPPLSFSEQGIKIDLTPPVMAITTAAKPHLILASNLKANGPPDISGVAWPTKDLFILASDALVQAVANQIETKLNGQHTSGSGSVAKGLLKYSYSATLNSIDITPAATDKTELNAAIHFSFDATATGAGGCPVANIAGKT